MISFTLPFIKVKFHVFNVYLKHFSLQRTVDRNSASSRHFNYSKDYTIPYFDMRIFWHFFEVVPTRRNFKNHYLGSYVARIYIYFITYFTKVKKVGSLLCRLSDYSPGPLLSTGRHFSLLQIPNTRRWQETFNQATESVPHTVTSRYSCPRVREPRRYHVHIMRQIRAYVAGYFRIRLNSSFLFPLRPTFNESLSRRRYKNIMSSKEKIARNENFNEYITKYRVGQAPLGIRGLRNKIHLELDSV